MAHYQTKINAKIGSALNYMRNRAALRTGFLFLMMLIFIATQAQKKEGKLVPNLKGFDEKQILFGFLIGVNTSTFSLKHSMASTPENNNNPRYAELLTLQPGINLGIVSSLRLRKNLNLRVLPGISFGQRDLSYIDADSLRYDDIKVKSTFIEMPIMLKYGGDRDHNFKPYIVAGINPRYDLAKKKQDGLLLNSFDLYYEFGFGFDSYLNYFRLSTELKISIGTRDILNHNGTGELLDMPYTQAIDKMTSRIFVLNFYFQ